MREESGNRWYDKHPELSGCMEKLKHAEYGGREKLIHEIKDIIMEYDDKLMDQHVADFPLTIKRRWYDNDPYSWVVVNTLKYADEVLLHKIICHLKEKL